MKGKKGNVNDAYRRKVELMCTVAQQRPRFSMVKKRKKKENESELDVKHNDTTDYYSNHGFTCI